MLLFSLLWRSVVRCSVVWYGMVWCDVGQGGTERCSVVPGGEVGIWIVIRAIEIKQPTLTNTSKQNHYLVAFVVAERCGAVRCGVVWCIVV